MFLPQSWSFWILWSGKKKRGREFWGILTFTFLPLIFRFFGLKSSLYFQKKVKVWFWTSKKRCQRVTLLLVWCFLRIHRHRILRANSTFQFLQYGEINLEGVFVVQKTNRCLPFETSWDFIIPKDLFEQIKSPKLPPWNRNHRCCYIQTLQTLQFHSFPPKITQEKVLFPFLLFPSSNTTKEKQVHKKEGQRSFWL